MLIMNDSRLTSGPKVSVIVPNYNHSPYLKERLRTVFEQILRPHEIVFLDDASTDKSVGIARHLASGSPAPFRLVVNEKNSGKTFRQWLKGISLASGDLIWIAESDEELKMVRTAECPLSGLDHHHGQLVSSQSRFDDPLRPVFRASAS